MIGNVNVTFWSGEFFIYFVSSIDDYAKDGGPGVV